MAREIFQTLTEPMFYILLSLKEERNGSEIAAFVQEITKKRVELPPGTLYALLAQFLEEDAIERVKSSGRGKNYIITEHGQELLKKEQERLRLLLKDYKNYFESA